MSAGFPCSVCGARHDFAYQCKGAPIDSGALPALTPLTPKPTSCKSCESLRAEVKALKLQIANGLIKHGKDKVYSGRDRAKHNEYQREYKARRRKG